MQKFVKWKNEPLKVIGCFDTVICGSGPGGLGAGYMSATSGMKTLIVERSHIPGGMASIGEIQPFMQNNHSSRLLDAPVYAMWRKQMKNYLDKPTASRWESAEEISRFRRLFDKNLAALAAEDILLEAGVKMLYGHTLVDVIASDRKIEFIVLHSKSGFSAVRSKIFIDCTGDGDMAALAKCRFETGDAQGHCQPLSICFKVGNVHIPNNNFYDQQWEDSLQELHAQAQEAGIISCQRESLLLFPTLESDVIHFNTTRVTGCDATNGESLSEANIIARRQLREYFFWMRKYLPGFENAKLLSMGTIGVRESRRITGIAKLTREMVVNGCCFPDAIARCSYPIDIHSPYGKGTEITPIGKPGYFEIPYGCIVPADMDNLLIGGRPISSDVAAHSSLRIMPCACSIGQAAGIAAALSIASDSAPAELNGISIREKLIAAGARLVDIDNTQKQFNPVNINHNRRK